MNFRILALFVLIGMVGLSYAALENYPRPWDNSTYLSGSSDFSAFWGLLEMSYDYSSLDEDELDELENVLGVLPDFQASLEQFQLERLKQESGDENFTEAIYWKNTAEEMRWEISASHSYDPTAVVMLAVDITLYPSAWGACVDSSFLSLEGYGKEVNTQRKLFEFWRGKIEYGGACDEEYVGRNIEYCELVLEDVECNYSGVWNSVPDFGWYPGCVEEHWNTSASLAEKVLEIETAYNDTVDSCEDAKAIASTKQNAAQSKFEEIESQKLEKIYPSGSGEVSSGAIGILGCYQEIQDKMAQGDQALALAKNADIGADVGWIKDCTMGTSNAIAAYDEVIQSNILIETEEVVRASREDAWGSVNQLEEKRDQLNELGEERLGSAISFCKKGDSSVILGERFEDYQECIRYVKLAEGNLGEAKDPIAEAQLTASLAWLEDFFAKADADGVDTYVAKLQYAILKENGIYDAGLIENIKKTVLNDAENLYGDLPGKRRFLKNTVAMGGAEFAYLNSWFDVGEECYSGDELDYSCALGRLREMEESYSDIEEDIEGKKSVLGQNSVVVSDWLTWEIPTLDEKSEIYLYVEVANPTNFDSENIEVEIPTDLSFRKIDLVSGEEHVRMVNPQKNKIEIYLTDINASETIHLIFKKEEIVCQTQDYEVSALGDSEGGATVTETLDIDCKYAVGGLVLGEMWDAQEITVDGLGLEVGDTGVDRELSKGKHTLIIQRYDYDAYEVEREVSFVSTIGQTTKTELFFNFEPNMDLDYIAYSSIEEGKDLNDLDVFGYTGEKISDKKIMGESTIFFKVYKLVEGKEAKVRVTYEISDLEDYVSQELLHYSSLNLTAQENSILNEAKNYLLVDEDVEAYKKIEELRSVVEKRAKTHNSLLSKHEKLKEKIAAKICSLESALALAQELGIGNAYVSEMSARLDELESVVESKVDETALTSPLETVDMGWEKKELTKISKELLSLEQELKERWAETGIEDEELFAAIESVEQKNSRFAGTLDFDDAILAFKEVEDGEGVLEVLEENSALEASANNALLQEKILGAEDLLESYCREYEEADGTHLEGIFLVKPSQITKELTELSKSGDYSKVIEEVEGLNNKMSGTLDTLEENEALLEENVETLYYELKDQMNELDSEFVNAAIQNAKTYAARGQYVQAIKSLEDALLKMESLEESDDGIIILAVTGLLVLGIIGLYLLRDQIPKDILPLREKEERPYKKLKREI